MMNNIVECKYPTPDSDFKLFETDKDEPLMCIQWENKELNALNRNNRFFDLLDEMFLRTYAEWVSNTIEKIIYHRIIKETGKLRRIKHFYVEEKDM